MAKINWREVRKYPLSAHRLQGKENIKNYCMGGNAIVTLTSPSNIHYSYYIRSPWMEDKDEFRKDVRFVYVMNSSNRWIYLGELCNNGQIFRKTYSSQFDVDTNEFKGMMYVVKMMNRDLNTPMILQHEGCCSRCGRRLVDPISIERGLGPKCFNLLYGQNSSRVEEEREEMSLDEFVEMASRSYSAFKNTEYDHLSMM